MQTQTSPTLPITAMIRNNLKNLSGLRALACLVHNADPMRLEEAIQVDWMDVGYLEQIRIVTQNPAFTALTPNEQHEARALLCKY